MAIEWTPDLATGSVSIDKQHQAIFQRINGMLDACRSGKGKSEVQGVFAFLEDYVISHFSAEEHFMKLRGHAGYGAHKRQHEECMRRMAEIKQSVQTSGAGVHTVIAVNHLLVSWFVNHIRKVDARLALLENADKSDGRLL